MPIKIVCHLADLKAVEVRFLFLAYLAKIKNIQMLGSAMIALSRKHRYTPVWLLLCGGISLSMIACITVGNWEEATRKTRFKNQADNLATALQQSIDSNLEVLQATGRFYAASEQVNRQEFRVFVKDFLVRYPSISGFNWTRRISATERPAFEQAIQAEGYPTFQITERGKQGKMVRAGQRPEYFSVTYTEPLEVQRGALGFDLASEPMRRAALEKARDTGALSTTGRITIVTTHQLGFLTFQPIYRKGASLESLPARRENFQGVTTAVFQIADIVKAALPGLVLDNMDFYLFDNSAVAKERFLTFYQSSTHQVMADPNHERSVEMGANSFCQRIVCTRTLKVADRQWTLLVLPAPGSVSIQDYWGAWTTLAIGLLLTTLLTIYLLMSLRHTGQVEQLVSERTAQAQQLSQTLKTLQLNMEMLDLANDSIVIRDLKDNIIYWNQGAERLYGWTKIDVLGQNIHSFLQTVFPKPLEEIMTVFLKQGYWEGELIHKKQDGQQILVESRWTLQRDDLGQITAMLEINNDITERKQALEALRQSEEREREKAKQLEQTLHELQKTQAQLIQTEKMSSLGQLVAGIAHEINNPVNFIYGNLTHTNEYAQDLLELVHLYQQEYPTPTPAIEEHTEAIDFNFMLEDLPKMLSSMKVGAERIRQIVLGLRNFSRLDEAEMKPVDIHEGIDSTLLILQNRLKAKPEHPGIQVIKEYGNLPLVECYAGQLNQVFMNIFTNAIDALDSYQQEGSTAEIQNNFNVIKICTEVLNADRVVVEITDNGAGMTQEVQKRLFDPFFTTKPVGRGTGLGLSISYQIIVEKHGGVLRCESELGQGTKFWIEIPLKQTQKIATHSLKPVLIS